MPRYIDADLILPEMESKFDMQELYLPVHFQEFIVDEIPTADVVPVVRCKDCVLHGHCSTEDVFLFSRLKSENAFCCVGKRKENDNG